MLKMMYKLSKAVHKNNSVSGRPAGWLKKGAAGNFFFHFCKKNFFFPKIDKIFMEKKNKVEKKKKIAAARLASILATRCTGNRNFFMDSLRRTVILKGIAQKWYYLRRLK